MTKTDLQPSVWQPQHWTPSKNAPSSEYFGRFAPIYDKIGTTNALSLEACISIQRSKQEMLRQIYESFVTFNSSDLQNVAINVTPSDLLRDGLIHWVKVLQDISIVAIMIID